MKAHRVQILGHFSAETGSEFYLKLKSLAIEPCLLLIDANQLQSVDEIGSVYWKKSVDLAEKNQCPIAICELPEPLHKTWKELGLSGQVPRFPSRTEAVDYLESFLDTSEPIVSEAKGTSETKEFPKNLESSDLEHHKSATEEPAPLPVVVDTDTETKTLEPIPPLKWKVKEPVPRIHWEIDCPHCGAMLRIYNKGNHACSTCHHKFYIHSNLRVTPFERL